MSAAARKHLLGTLLLLSGGAIGWLYGAPLEGLLVAALGALAWQIRHLLRFDRGVHSGTHDIAAFGDGIWDQLAARIDFERARSLRRKMRYRALLKELRNSTNALPDGAVVLDARNDIVTCNKAAKTLAGLKRKKDRGQRIDNILRDPAVGRLLDHDDAAESVEIESPVRDGNWLNCRIVPYGAAQKLLLLRDVTEQKRLAKMRRDFVANASHELRSPLTVISGYLDAMADDDAMPNTWSRPLQQMRSQAERMKNLLNEMLELSRLESAGRAKAEPVAVTDMLQRICEQYRAQLDAVSIELQLDYAGSLLGVDTEIESVVVNLLTNAIRHTPAGGTISLAWRRRDDGAELVVADSGEGIEADLIPRLTERFFRINRGRSRDDGGIGLGLAIVKHVLARHEAELVVSSTPGEGSRFCCRFPAHRVGPVQRLRSVTKLQ